MASHVSLGNRRAEALDILDRWLVGSLRAERVVEPRAGYTTAWSITANVADQEVPLEVAVSSDFPRSLPKIFLVNPPPFPTWPHIEKDGSLCVATPLARYDRTKPAEVIQSLLSGALGILSDGISGTNVDDFRAEFSAYWIHFCRGRTIRSLLDPSEPSRRIQLWRGQGFSLVAEDASSIRQWLANTGKVAVADSKIERTVLLWLPQPLLPSEYPNSADDLFSIAEGAVGGGAALLRTHFENIAVGHSTIIIGSESGNGSCFGGVEIVAPRFRKYARRKSNQQAAVPPELGRKLIKRLVVWAKA